MQPFALHSKIAKALAEHCRTEVLAFVVPDHLGTFHHYQVETAGSRQVIPLSDFIVDMLDLQEQLALFDDEIFSDKWLDKEIKGLKYDEEGRKAEESGETLSESSPEDVSAAIDGVLGGR